MLSGKADASICVSVDRTTYASGRAVAHDVIGVSRNCQMLSEKSVLRLCDERSATNRTEIARISNQAVQTLWPDGVK